jgi:serine/threonine protein kinase
VSSELHATLRELHDTGWYHGDLSPRNLMWRLLTGSTGGVVRTLEDVELVVIDFGMSRKRTSFTPPNFGHTKPFGTKYFLPDAQCLLLTVWRSDFFQALQVVIRLAIMHSGNISRALGNDTTDFKGLGSRWLTQDKPWLTFIVTHEKSSCEELIHEIYCTPCRNFFESDMTEVTRIDQMFSPSQKQVR